MSLVRVHNFSISLDGFGTGEPSEPRRTVRPRRRTAARMDVRHPVVARARRARWRRRRRRRLRPAARSGDRRRDHGRREVRLPRMARGPGVEGLVGSQPAVPHTGLRPHPSPAPVDRDGGRHDVPLPRRLARRGARDGPRGRGRPGRAHRWRRHRDPRLPCCRARRPHAHRGRPDPARPRRAALGRTGGPREGLRGRGHLLAQRSHARDVHPCGCLTAHDAVVEVLLSAWRARAAWRCRTVAASRARCRASSPVPPRACRTSRAGPSWVLGGPRRSTSRSPWRRA